VSNHSPACQFRLCPEVLNILRLLITISLLSVPAAMLLLRGVKKTIAVDLQSSLKLPVKGYPAVVGEEEVAPQLLP
jgi:hypothetical protein